MPELHLTGATFIGVNRGVEHRSLYRAGIDGRGLERGIDWDRLRIDTGRIPLQQKSELFTVGRYRVANDVLTWVGLYTFGIEPGNGRAGGYKALGLWFSGGAFDPRLVVKVLRKALYKLDRDFDYVEPYEWIENRDALTLESLSITNEMIGYLERPWAHCDPIRQGLGYHDGRHACGFDLSTAPEDAGLEAVLRLVQQDQRFNAYNLAMISSVPDHVKGMQFGDRLDMFGPQGEPTAGTGLVDARSSRELRSDSPARSLLSSRLFSSDRTSRTEADSMPVLSDIADQIERMSQDLRRLDQRIRDSSQSDLNEAATGPTIGSNPYVQIVAISLCVWLLLNLPHVWTQLQELMFNPVAVSTGPVATTQKPPAASPQPPAKGTDGSTQPTTPREPPGATSEPADQGLPAAKTQTPPQQQPPKSKKAERDAREAAQKAIDALASHADGVTAGLEALQYASLTKADGTGLKSDVSADQRARLEKLRDALGAFLEAPPRPPSADPGSPGSATPANTTDTRPAPPNGLR